MGCVPEIGHGFRRFLGRLKLSYLMLTPETVVCLVHGTELDDLTGYIRETRPLNCEQ